MISDAPVLTSACLAIALVACGGPAAVTVANPLRGGVVASNRVAVADANLAMQYHVPLDTFTSTASLASLDYQRVCFDVLVRSDEFRPELATPPGWHATLSTSDGFRSTEPMFGALSPLHQRTLMGSIDEVALVSNQGCGMGNPMGALCGSVSPGFSGASTSSTIATVRVLTGSGTVCFRHLGRIGEDTAALTLELVDPESQHQRCEFRWNLTNR